MIRLGFAGIGLAMALGLGAGPALAGEAADQVAASCRDGTDMTPEVCACVGQAAEERLNALQQRLFVAEITGDDEARTDLRKELPLNEQMQVLAFKLEAPQRCAR